jgi:ParB family transcriptional regulator, chromosome partitioning protein
MENKTLQEIKVEDISPNPYNPRIYFDPDDLEELKKSLNKVGVLVPITVYENKRNIPKTPFILLDGERRWRCAKELGWDSIKANIIDEPSDITQNILFMFNIHHYRKEWELFPTALKLEVIIKEIGTDSESVLFEFTGVSRSMIRRCKTLLWFPTQFREILLDNKAKVSTDFFIEIHPIVHRLSNEDEYLYPEGTVKLTNAFIDKFEGQRVISDVKEFREVRKAMGYFEKTYNFSEFKEKISEFISSPDAGLEIFASPDIDEEITRKNILKYVSYLNSNLKQANPDLISDVYIVEQLKDLEKTIRTLIERID